MDKCCWILEAYDEKGRRVSEAFPAFCDEELYDGRDKLLTLRQPREIASAKLYVTAKTTIRSVTLVLYGPRLRRLHEVHQRLNIGAHVAAGDFALLSVFVSVRERVAALRAETLYAKA